MDITTDKGWDPSELLDEQRDEHSLSPRWEGKRFAWLKVLLPAAKGRVGEKWVKEMAQTAGVTVTPRTNSGHDTVLNGTKVEVKLSTAYDTPADEDSYVQFLQIRPSSDAEVYALVAVCPDHTHMWMATAATVKKLSVGHHTGKDATETLKLRIDDPHNPPSELGADCAASKDTFLRRLQRASRLATRTR